jgi:hypothetical protein
LLISFDPLFSFTFSYTQPALALDLVKDFEACKKLSKVRDTKANYQELLKKPAMIFNMKAIRDKGADLSSNKLSITSSFLDILGYDFMKLVSYCMRVGLPE